MIKKIYFYLFASNILFGATLNVYQDQSIYNYKPDNSYIGFTKGISATCNQKDIEIVQKLTCPKKERICKLYKEKLSNHNSLNETIVNIKMIDALVSTKSKEELDANKLIENAKIISQEKGKLIAKQNLLKEQAKLLNRNFINSTTAKLAIYTKNLCEDDLSIKIPYSHLNFKVVYEADIQNRDKIKITQKLVIVNRSGIDIDAKEANFYYTTLNSYVEPARFSPWIVQEFNPNRYISKAPRAKVLSQAANVVMLDESSEKGGDIAPIAPSPVGKYNDAREYSVKNLKLLSNINKPTKVNILEYISDVECKLKSYPYSSLNAFYICSFKPKYQVDANSWQIKEDGKTINKDAIGEYRDNRYNLYTKIDKDISIKRVPIVKKERQSGIFGGTKRQKDGYNIILINKSKKEKKLQIIERIPTSQTQKIEVKLLAIKPNVDYKVLKDGKIEINLTLKPNETKNIKVLFELSYDKDLKVEY